MSDDRSIVVVVVFSFLGFFSFFGFCFVALWFLLTRKRKKLVQKAEIIRDDEHFKVKKDVVKGPHGEEAVIVTMEKISISEEKISKLREEEVEAKRVKGQNGEFTATDVEAGESSGNSSYIEYKP